MQQPRSTTSGGAGSGSTGFAALGLLGQQGGWSNTGVPIQQAPALQQSQQRRANTDKEIAAVLLQRLESTGMFASGGGGRGARALRTDWQRRLEAQFQPDDGRRRQNSFGLLRYWVAADSAQDVTVSKRYPALP